MANVRFDGADRAKTCVAGVAAVRLGKRGQFDRIPDMCRCAMCLYERNGRGVHAAHREGLRDCSGLALDAGRKVAGFHRAVIINSSGPDDGGDPVAIRQGVAQTP